MSKKTPVKQAGKQNDTLASSFSLSHYIPEKYHIPMVIGIVVVLFLIFLNPLYFGGKTFSSSDIVASESMHPYLQKDRDGFTLWNPHIFLGMPSYALSVGYTWFNGIYVVFTAARDIFSSFFTVDYAKWSFYLLLLAVTMFLYVRQLTGRTLIALFAGLSAAFSTGIIVFLYIGHVTKLTALCLYPVVFLLLFRFEKKITLLDFLLMVITANLLIQGFHVQIIFYTMLSVAIYYLYFLIRNFARKNKDAVKQLFKSGFSFAAAIILGVLIQSDNLSQIYEYTPYSTRGTKGILEETAATPASKAESDYYDYHTRWSFSPEEIATFVVPSFYGFGNSEYSGPETGGQPVKINTYFGQMEFVDVAMYMGVLVFFLALYAMITMQHNPLVQFLTILNLFALLVSFGKNFPIIFDALFYYFPYFDKFRVPSMILVIPQMIMPVLASLGIWNLVSQKEKGTLKHASLMRYAAYVFSGLLVLTLVLQSQFSSWFIERAMDSNVGRQIAQAKYDFLFTFMADMFTTDLIIAMAIMTVASWMALLYFRGKVSADILAVVLVVLTLGDLWHISGRGGEYTPAAPDGSKLFVEPGYVSIIKSQNNTEPFRMMNISGDGRPGSLNMNSNFHAYFLLEDFYGYSAIKPRGYQDILDVLQSKGMNAPISPSLWRMLNVKYIVSDQLLAAPGDPLSPYALADSADGKMIYEFKNALPRIYFVDSLALATPIDALNKMIEPNFDAKKLAFVHTSLPAVQSPDSTASVKITRYADEIITADIHATGNNFLFLGATYVGNGWKASIDGQETEILRTNHNFMGIVVPAGKHTVTFEYAPVSFTIAKNLSLGISYVVLIGLAVSIAISIVRKKKVEKQAA